MDPAALDSVYQRPAERGPLLPQCGDRMRDLARGGQVVLDQGGELRGVLLGDLDAPRHTVPFLIKAGLNSRHALILCVRKNRRQPTSCLRLAMPEPIIGTEMLMPLAIKLEARIQATVSRA